MKLTRLLAFAAIGTAIGLLLTTDKGKALRKDLTDRSGDLLNRLTKVGKQATNGVHKAVKEAV